MLKLRYYRVKTNSNLFLMKISKIFLLSYTEPHLSRRRRFKIALTILSLRTTEAIKTQSCSRWLYIHIQYLKFWVLKLQLSSLQEHLHVLPHFLNEQGRLTTPHPHPENTLWGEVFSETAGFFSVSTFWKLLFKEPYFTWPLCFSHHLITIQLFLKKYSWNYLLCWIYIIFVLLLYNVLYIKIFYKKN